jgi:thiol-disulfide isomerase/thioredoxin
MNRIVNLVIVIVLAIITVPACDIVEEPYLVPVGTGNDTIPGDEKVRKVLLEDYTGQKCPNCPEAAEIAHALQEVYGEQLVLLTIHAGFYSVPDDSGDFTADYRTPEGDELNSYFGFPGYPAGMVNRAEFSGSRILPKGSWEAAVEEQVSLDPQADIVITNNYNSVNRELECILETEYLEDLDGTYNICVFIIESGIVSPQLTSGGVNYTYEHNHVLRTSMSGTWGEIAGSDGQAVGGTKVTNSYSLTLSPEWNDGNCSVVAFIYNTESLEIVQAEEEDF